MTGSRLGLHVVIACVAACATAGVAGTVHLDAQAIPPMGVCRPIVDRAGDAPGCWIVTNEVIGVVAGHETYWHLDTYATRAAATAAKGARGTIVEAFGKVWLFTIQEDKDWRPAGGSHVASIGPLPVTAGTRYTAQYTGSAAAARHDLARPSSSGTGSLVRAVGGNLSRAPAGTSVARVGGPPVIVPGGVPMHLTSIGTETRRSLVLVLHDSQQPAGTEIHDWAPKGLCK